MPQTSEIFTTIRQAIETTNRRKSFTLAQLLTFCDSSEYSVPVDSSFNLSGYVNSDYMVVCSTYGEGVTKLPFKSYEEAEAYVNTLDRRKTEARILSSYGLIFRSGETTLVIESEKERLCFIKNELKGTYILKSKHTKQCIENI